VTADHHQFDLCIDLGHFITEDAPAISRDLQNAIYDTLDDLGLEYRVITAAISNMDELFGDGEAPDKNDIGGFRADDPSTSQKGAIDAYPRSGSQRWTALTVIADSPYGMTYMDVEVRTGIKGIWKRISELKEGGWVTTKGTRNIPETGSDGDVYVATPKALRYIMDKEDLTQFDNL
jgi:hypothetical protein